MDQHHNNSHNYFLWSLLANPAQDAHLYAYNLQQLVNDYPQSGILQALLAHASEEKNLKQASAYFNPKSLYKLINAPSGFTRVPGESMIIQPNIASSENYRADSFLHIPQETPVYHEAEVTTHQPEEHHTEQPFLEAVQEQHLLVDHVQPVAIEEHIEHVASPVVNEDEVTEPPHHDIIHEVEGLVAGAGISGFLANELGHLVPDAAMPAVENIAHSVTDFFHHTPEEPTAEHIETVHEQSTDESLAVHHDHAGAGDAPVGILKNIVPEEIHQYFTTTEETTSHVVNEHATPIHEMQPMAEHQGEDVHQHTEAIIQEPTQTFENAVTEYAEPIAETVPIVEHHAEEEVHQHVEAVVAEPVHTIENKIEEFAVPVAATQNVVEHKAEEQVHHEQKPIDDETFDEITPIEHINTTPQIHAPEPTFDQKFGAHKAIEPITAKAEPTKSATADQSDLSKYHDETMPYSFMWWLNKTRKDHSNTYQPYSKPEVEVGAEKVKTPSADELQQQYYENIFHVTSPAEEMIKKAPAARYAFNSKPKEHAIIERFIQEEPQIKPQGSEKLDTENKAKKSSEDRDELVTETLASIYTDQMLYHKAIASYKKLMLKFPEKSSYFAGKIEQLEKKTN